MTSLEYYAAVARTQAELEKMLKGKLTKEILLFIENYPLYLKSLLQEYGTEKIVLGFMQAYSQNPHKPSFSELENCIKNLV